MMWKRKMKWMLFQAIILCCKTTWASEMNIVVNHAPGERQIARPIDLQSSVLLLCY